MIRVLVFPGCATHGKHGLTPVITAAVLALRVARDCFFSASFVTKWEERKTCHAHLKPVVSSYQFRMHTASDTFWLTDRHIRIVSTLSNYSWCSRTQKSLFELLSLGTCVSISTRHKKKLCFLRISPPAAPSSAASSFFGAFAPHRQRLL